jgi:predicted secreted protein
MSGGHYGREVLFFWNGDEIEGVREKNLTINGEAEDVSSDEDSGYRVLLDADSQSSIDIAISGVSKSPGVEILRLAKLTRNIRGTAKIRWKNGDELEFTANIAGLEFGLEHESAATFSGTLQSSGAWTYTEGS